MKPKLGLASCPRVKRSLNLADLATTKPPLVVGKPKMVVKSKGSVPKMAETLRLMIYLKIAQFLFFVAHLFFIMKVMIHTIHTIHTWVFTEKTVQDWRIGAFHFEDVLLDYDVAMNYGNWVVVSEATSKTWAEEMKSYFLYF